MSIRNKTIIVTGGAGFIGTNLVKRLSMDNTVIVIDNYTTGTKDNNQPRAVYLDKDIRDIDSVHFNKIDICFHLAAHSRIQPSFKHPKETFDVNTRGTLEVLAWCLKHKVKKVIYSGSSSKWHNPRISPYATAKYLGEELCKMYQSTFGLNVDIARFYNVYGEYEILNGDWAAIIGKWRGLIADGKPVTIVGDGTQRRAFTHIDDIVDGLIKVADTNALSGDAWELGAGVNYSINEVFDFFKERYPDIEKINVPKRPGEYSETHRESSNAIDQLYWKPEDRLKDYILSL